MNRFQCAGMEVHGDVQAQAIHKSLTMMVLHTLDATVVPIWAEVREAMTDIHKTKGLLEAATRKTFCDSATRDMDIIMNQHVITTLKRHLDDVDPSWRAQR
jgi:hypothetical protein